MKIVVVVDVQNDFIDGALGTKVAQAAIPKIADSLIAANKNDEILIFTQDTHLNDYLFTLEGRKLPVPHCIEGTRGWLVNEDVDDCFAGHICKSTFGSFQLIEMIESLSKHNIITEIELFGFCTDICVISNAILLKNYFPFIEITVNADLCAGSTPYMHEAALKVMNSCQINIRTEEA